MEINSLLVYHHTMSISEFDMINRLFRDRGINRPDTLLAIGDDAALIETDNKCPQLSCVLQWVAGMDYPVNEAPDILASKIMAQIINHAAERQFSPQWMTLSLTLEILDIERIELFSHALLTSADLANIQLIGGDTSHGPETIRIHLIGTQ